MRDERVETPFYTVCALIIMSQVGPPTASWEADQGQGQGSRTLECDTVSHPLELSVQRPKVSVDNPEQPIL